MSHTDDYVYPSRLSNIAKGITKREYIAAQIIAHCDLKIKEADLAAETKRVAKVCLAYADALLAEFEVVK